MTIKKVKQNWYVNDEKLSLYELYCVYGQSADFINKWGKVRPSNFTINHVSGFIPFMISKGWRK